MKRGGQCGAGGEPSRAAAVWLALGCSALAALIYGWGVAGGFVFDDEKSVVDNPTIRRLGDVRAVWSPPVSSPVGGRPVANFTFALNHAAGGLDPRGYRVVNTALHAGAALLLFGAVRRTLGRMAVRGAGGLAAAAALLWLAHPVQTSCVTYVAQRTELLMAFFLLLTLYAFIRGAAEREGPPGGAERRWLAGSVVACALGMASKEVMVTAPVIVFFHDAVFVAGSAAAAWRRRWRYYLALAATWLLLAWLMAQGIGQRGVGYGLGVGAWSYALTETKAVVTYLRLVPWPHPLVFDYGREFLASVRSAWPFAGVVAVALALTVFALRRWPRAGFLAATFFLLLAPTSTIVPVAAQPLAESRLYLPLACLVTLGVVGLNRIAPRWTLAACGLIGLGWTAQSLARVLVVRDPIALWQDTLAKRPNNARAHGNLAAILLGAGRAEAAIAHARRGLELDPTMAPAHGNLAAALFSLGRTDEAVAHGRRAIELDPTMARAHSNLAGPLLQQGRAEEALRHAREALRLVPHLIDANYQAGNALARLGRLAEAADHYRAEIRLRPDYPESYLNLGCTLYLLGRPAEAVAEFEETLRRKPGYLEAQRNLASALAQAGRAGEAIETYRRVLASQPGDVVARANLGLVLTQAGRLDEAEAEFRAALRLQPDLAAARDGLAQIEQVRAARDRR